MKTRKSLKKLIKIKMDKKALRRSLWGSLSRVVGVAMAFSASSLIRQLAPDLLSGWTVAILMAAGSFLLIWFAEYEREI